jgi:ParB-like chromosome segregation protein Spo0J
LAKKTNAKLINEAYEITPCEKLKVHPRNVNQGDLKAIENSIGANGFYGAVVAQKSTGYVLAGNHRFMAAKDANLREIPVIWVDVDDDRALRIMLADNRTTRLGKDDQSALAELLSDLATTDLALEGTAYSGDDLDDIIAGLEKEEGGETRDSDERQKEMDYKSQYGVIVMCESESEQERVYTELNSAGYTVKVVSV